MPMSKDEVLLTQDEESLGGEALVFSIPQEFIGERVDKVLRQLYPELSRAQWQRLVREGQVTLQGSPIRANYKVIGGESIQALLPPPLPTDIIPEEIPIDIIYEDETMLAINKPAGIVMHPATGHESGTVANAIVYHFPDVLDVGGERRPGLVHRLDKETSGVLVAAKDDVAHRHLSAQFKAHSISRRYLALVYGLVPKEAGVVDRPIGRHPSDRKRMSGQARVGRRAVNRWKVLRRYDLDRLTLVELTLETGRTHQIRVHFSEMNHPLVGDPVYGGANRSGSLSDAWLRSRVRAMGRQFLHARLLGLVHPVSGEYMEFGSPLPQELQALLDHLDAKSAPQS